MINRPLEPIPLKVRLRVWRLGRKLSLKEAAAYIGVPTRTYMGWEYGSAQPAKNKCRDCVERKLNE